jgi:hypothetical protein
LDTLWNKFEDILRDELALELEESEAKLANLFGNLKYHKPVVKPISNENLKTKTDDKEDTKKSKDNVVKSPIKEVLKEHEKEETLADILQLLSVVKRPSWSEPRDDYEPRVYTSNLIIENAKADVDLLDL